MNGRIYDPVIGRFLSADPFVQEKYNLQSYNRYSYVLNNPLKYTDPSGYFGIKKFFKKVGINIARAIAYAASYITQQPYIAMAFEAAKSSYQAKKNGAGALGIFKAALGGAYKGYNRYYYYKGRHGGGIGSSRGIGGGIGGVGPGGQRSILIANIKDEMEGASPTSLDSKKRVDALIGLGKIIGNISQIEESEEVMGIVIIDAKSLSNEKDWISISEGFSKVWGFNRRKVIDGVNDQGYVDYHMETRSNVVGVFIATSVDQAKVIIDKYGQGKPVAHISHGSTKTSKGHLFTSGTDPEGFFNSREFREFYQSCGASDGYRFGCREELYGGSQDIDEIWDNGLRARLRRWRGDF